MHRAETMKKSNLDVKKQLKGQWRVGYLYQREQEVCSFKGEELLNKR